MASLKHKRVTLKDVAAACDYSINTVSRAMRDDDKLPIATRKRIRVLASQMGYIPNSLASSLRSSTSHTVAIIVNDIHNQHYSILLSEMDSGLRAIGYNTMIMCMQLDEQLAERLIQVAISHSVDGVFYFPYHGDPRQVDTMIENGMPFVLVDRWIQGITADTVRCDDDHGGYLAGSHLTALGHKRFLFLAGILTSSSQLDRYAGFLRALAEAGLGEDAVRTVSWEAFVDASEHDRMPELLQPLDYTAVVAFSDEIGYHVLNGLQALGARVPHDVSVISFDHIRGGISYLPALTSIACQRGELSRSAIELLRYRLRKPALPAQSIVLPVCVYDEGTTGKPRKRTRLA